MPSLHQIFLWLIQYKYAIIIPVTAIEGPIISIISGFLFRLGYLNFWLALCALVAGDIIGDVFYYCLGRFGSRKLISRYGKYVNLTPENMAKVEKKFRQHENKTLLLSKMTNGLGFALAVLILAGYLKIDFKKFILLNLIGGFVWSAFLLMIGYFFGHLYETIDVAFRDSFLVGGLIAVIALVYGFRKFTQKAAQKAKI